MPSADTPWSTDRLHAALREHDRARRQDGAGVIASELDADNALWISLGAAIANLARTVRQACRDSCYCDDRPDVAALAARLAESIDDQVDAAAWGVIQAAARLHIGERLR